jgi:hypothetical protein
MTDPKPGWNKGEGYWARPEHVHEIKGDYPSQDRVALDPEVVRHIRESDRTEGQTTATSAARLK